MNVRLSLEQSIRSYYSVHVTEHVCIVTSIHRNAETIRKMLDQIKQENLFSHSLDFHLENIIRTPQVRAVIDQCIRWLIFRI